jgi:hypothetical protein
MAYGQRTTYTDTTNQKRSISDLIFMIDWVEAPALNLFGVTNEAKFQLVNWPSTKVEWLEDGLSPTTTTMNDSGGISDSDTSMVVATGTGQYFKEGDIIRIEDELIYVSARATDTLTIVRAFGGTTNASHADALTITLVTVARLEGADYDTGHTTVVSARSEAKMMKYGVSDTMDYKIAKLIGGGSGVEGSKGKAGKLAILLAKTFWHGKRAVGSASASRAMGGFTQYVTTNVKNCSSAALTLKDIEDKMQACFEAGGQPETILCGSWAKRKISSFYKGAIRTERMDKYFGELEVMFDKWAPTNAMAIVERDKMGWITFDAFKENDKPSMGDYTVKEVLGEYSFVLTNETAHAYIYGFSTSK